MTLNSDNNRLSIQEPSANALSVEKDYSVTEFTQRLQNALEKALPACWITGEISNFTAATSGHWYFNLKEAQAQIRCVMFRFRQGGSTLRPSSGMAVRLQGTLSYYAPNGTCQILVEQLRPAGQGALFEAFNRLKQRYAAAGYFDASRKRPLPPFPRTLGVLTSPVGAAWRDVLTTLQRRAPQVAIILYPIPVQGEGAAAEIARRLTSASSRAECDVLLLCRGGGSLEDLWAFNEPAVVEAMLACALPIITGIGHETDFTLADFVADRRAPTPTAAAELVHPERNVLQQHLGQLAPRLRQAQERRLERALLHQTTLRLRWEKVQQQYWLHARQQLQLLSQRLIHPEQRLAGQRQRLDHLRLRWRTQGQRYLDLWQRIQDSRQQRWQTMNTLVMARYQQHLDTHRRTLQHLSPHAILGRGYALVQDEAGHVLDRVEALHDLRLVSITLADGTRRAQILAINTEAQELPHPLGG